MFLHGFWSLFERFRCPSQGPAPVMAAEAMLCFGHLDFSSSQGVRRLLEVDRMHELRHVVQHQVVGQWLLQGCLHYNLVLSNGTLRRAVDELPRGTPLTCAGRWGLARSSGCESRPWPPAEELLEPQKLNAKALQWPGSVRTASWRPREAPGRPVRRSTRRWAPRCASRCAAWAGRSKCYPRHLGSQVRGALGSKESCRASCLVPRTQAFRLLKGDMELRSSIAAAHWPTAASSCWSAPATCCYACRPGAKDMKATLKL